MSEAVYQVMTALSTLVTPLPMGPNLGLLHLLWTLVSGRLLASRGALFPALQETGLSDAAGAARLGGADVARLEQ